MSAREIKWFFTFRTVAVTALAICFTTAIVVGNQVILVIDRIVAGADPVGGRRLTTRRAAAFAAATTGAKRATYGAVPPVVTSFWITHFVWYIG